MGDVLKLVSFFKDMKTINDEFFYDIQVDKDKSIKTFSGPMQAAEEPIKTSAIA